MMNQSLEWTGRTVEEAIQRGLDELGLDREDVDVDVISEGRSGLLGIPIGRCASPPAGAARAMMRISTHPSRPSPRMQRAHEKSSLNYSATWTSTLTFPSMFPEATPLVPLNPEIL